MSHLHDKEPGTGAPDPKTDIPLFSAPRKTPHDSPAPHRGTDLLAHKTPAGTVSFYFYFWHTTRTYGRTGTVRLTSAESAKWFLRDRILEWHPAKAPAGECSGLHHEHLRELLPDLYRDPEGGP